MAKIDHGAPDNDKDYEQAPSAVGSSGYMFQLINDVFFQNYSRSSSLEVVSPQNGSIESCILTFKQRGGISQVLKHHPTNESLVSAKSGNLYAILRPYAQPGTPHYFHRVDISLGGVDHRYPYLSERSSAFALASHSKYSLIASWKRNAASSRSDTSSSRNSP
jgi:hypothetical protein